MRKLLFAAIAVAVVLWVVSWFRTPEAVAHSAGRPWPGGLGTLETVEARYPAVAANEAAIKLATLAGKLPKDDSVTEFVAREMSRGNLEIGKPPALPDVSTARDLLLQSPIVWKRSGGVGEIGDQETSARRVVQMTTARALVASALARAQQQDGAAWDDLHAAWKLARSIEPQPQMMEQTAALSISRMINAVAWKMPLPVPAWFAELQGRDAVPRLIEAFQYVVAAYCESGSAVFPTKMLAASVDHDRAIAETLSTLDVCETRVPMNDLGTDLRSVWQRAFRYRAEREGTANALRIREGRSIVTASRCRGGAWSFDGNTLRFSHEIPTYSSERPAPLVMRVTE